MSSRGGGNYGNRGGPYGGGGGGGSYRGDYQPRRGGRGRGNWRGGNRGRGANMQPVSRPQHNTTEDRLDSLIIRIGEKSNQSLQNNLLVLSEVLNRELETHRHKILATMGACIHELPHKTTIYTTLVGLINAKNFDFGQCFVEYIVHVLFKSFLEDNEFVKIRVTVRFVADLVNCNVVSSDSVIDMYHEFLKVADETDIPQERSDLYLECVMASLPWVGLELSQSRSKELDEIMRRLDTYMAHRNTSYTQCMNVWRDDAHNTSPAQVESMEALWTQVKTLENKRWDDQAIYRPYLSFDHELTEATPHTIPSISIPVHMHGTSIYPLRSVVFRLWEESDIPRDLPQLQKNDDIERYVIDQQVRELIITFNGSRKDCVKNMIAIPYGDRFPLEYIVVEVIFAELFRLPTPDFRAVYYGSLLLELCKLPESPFIGIVRAAVHLLFERVEYMDIECVQRLSAWLSWHFSNIDFKWEWHEWSEVLALPDLDPKRMFVVETLNKCVRLSYRERIKRTLAPEMADELLPPEAVPNFKYEDASTGLGEMAAKLVDAFRERQSSDQIAKMLDEQVTPELLRSEGTSAIGFDAESSEEEQLSLLQLSVFTQCVLKAGAKSYSHIMVYLERYLSIFHERASGTEQKQHIVAEVMDLWSTNEQMVIILLDKMMTYRVVHHQSIINCVFSHHNLESLPRDYMWETLTNTLDKLIARSNQVRAAVKKLEVPLTEEEIQAAIAAREDIMNMDEDLPADVDPEEYRKDKLADMNETLTDVLQEQKEAFLVVFQQFIVVIGTYFEEKGYIEGTNISSDPWCTVVLGRLLSFGRRYHREIAGFLVTLESLVFTSDCNSQILEVFAQFKDMHR